MSDVDSKAITSILFKDGSIRKKDVFVGNLSLFTDNTKLSDYFSQFGELLMVQVKLRSSVFLNYKSK